MAPFPAVGPLERLLSDPAPLSPGVGSVPDAFQSHSEQEFSRVSLEEENKSYGATNLPPPLPNKEMFFRNTPDTPLQTTNVDSFQLGEFIENQSGAAGSVSNSSLVTTAKVHHQLSPALRYDCHYSVVGCDNNLPNESLDPCAYCKNALSLSVQINHPGLVGMDTYQ